MKYWKPLLVLILGGLAALRFWPIKKPSLNSPEKVFLDDQVKKNKDKLKDLEKKKKTPVKDLKDEEVIAYWKN